ncbi:ATP synthase F0 subunit 8 (mitochondrion) [Plodia interpunctella]|uniref:ATP synthase complex subunit 8 n=1 Tax=Plodia interpunctella TaxID=58824 RepID=A0A0M4FJ08_PLOIN|nr:ATP synthase F0 subunit 8 [Plodia interpunctella]AKM22513.1 ATP synthase F0 subunit 8 [Plodia interpunctella]ALC76001.1 ATP synthase F0 subunit 8 [Plodia interpunctella]ALN11748.1 ATP synthase F0 subunit 8 [Plodia interpunctella]QGW14875.1 ATP synthase F0 subunit 8 [Plodia interpunctella]
MPQMMPINWIMSFFFFILIFIMFNMMNYYISMSKPSLNFSNKKFSLKNFNWKW